jgi:hypothetical protein
MNYKKHVLEKIIDLDPSISSKPISVGDLVDCCINNNLSYSLSYLKTVLANSCADNTYGDPNNSGYKVRVERLDRNLYRLII